MAPAVDNRLFNGARSKQSTPAVIIRLFNGRQQYKINYSIADRSKSTIQWTSAVNKRLTNGRPH